MDRVILRYVRRSLGQAAAMARHALRESPTPNADPTKLAKNTVFGPNTVAGIMVALRDKLPADRRKNAVPCVEFLVSASPEALRAMSRKDQDDYFTRAQAWIGDAFGGQDNIVSSVVHRDETTPHLQLLLVPLLDGKLNAKALIGNRTRMEERQTGFADRVGKPFGLKRGEKGSKAKHTTIRQFYGAIEAAGSASALPPRVPMPDALPEPGMLTSKATREAYELRKKEREAARAANAKRQREIERLAAIGIAAKGKTARRTLPELQKQVDEKQDEVARASGLLANQRKKYDATTTVLARLNEQVETAREVLGSGALMRERDQLQAEVNELRNELRQRRR